MNEFEGSYWQEGRTALADPDIEPGLDTGIDTDPNDHLAKENKPEEIDAQDYIFKDGDLTPLRANSEVGVNTEPLKDQLHGAALDLHLRVIEALENGEQAVSVKMLGLEGHTEHTERYVIMEYIVVEVRADGSMVVEIRAKTEDRPREIVVEEDGELDDGVPSREILVDMPKPLATSSSAAAPVIAPQRQPEHQHSALTKSPPEEAAPTHPTVPDIDNARKETAINYAVITATESYEAAHPAHEPENEYASQTPTTNDIQSAFLEPQFQPPEPQKLVVPASTIITAAIPEAPTTEPSVFKAEPSVKPTKLEPLAPIKHHETKVVDDEPTETPVQSTQPNVSIVDKPESQVQRNEPQFPITSKIALPKEPAPVVLPKPLKPEVVQASDPVALPIEIPTVHLEVLSAKPVKAVPVPLEEPSSHVTGQALGPAPDSPSGPSRALEVPSGGLIILPTESTQAESETKLAAVTPKIPHGIFEADALVATLTTSTEIPASLTSEIQLKNPGIGELESVDECAQQELAAPAISESAHDETPALASKSVFEAATTLEQFMDPKLNLTEEITQPALASDSLAAIEQPLAQSEIRASASETHAQIGVVHFNQEQPPVSTDLPDQTVREQAEAQSETQATVLAANEALIVHAPDFVQEGVQRIAIETNESDVGKHDAAKIIPASEEPGSIFEYTPAPHIAKPVINKYLLRPGTQAIVNTGEPEAEISELEPINPVTSLEQWRIPRPAPVSSATNRLLADDEELSISFDTAATGRQSGRRRDTSTTKAAA